jgi:hypothetical protein
MESFGLVVHDEQTFFSKVVNSGMEQGLFTRDRADEIIRVSIAMANKYVIQKEVDFRSTEELAKVQETVLKLIGVGLEIKSKGEVETAVSLLMEASPVELFRLAYTRIDKLRHSWRQLLQDHKIPILVRPDEYECLADLTCQRLANMSIFTDSELHTVSSLTLSDELFSALSLVEYYESELERFQFILRLKDILPFDLLNRSPNLEAENLSEVDSLRESLINTLVIGTYTNSSDPVTVSMEDVRAFLEGIDVEAAMSLFPEDVENAVLDVIQELGEDLEESEGALLAKEIIHTSQKLIETVVSEWDTITSSSENIFFKRWCRLVILSGTPDPLERILSEKTMLDEFDFEMLFSQLLNGSPERVAGIIQRLPWSRMNADQIIRLFHSLEQYQEQLADQADLTGFNSAELIDLLEELTPAALQRLIPALTKPFQDAQFSMEDLEIVAGLPDTESIALLMKTGGPSDYTREQILQEYKDGSDQTKRVLFYSCSGTEIFGTLFQEAWAMDQAQVRKMMKTVPMNEIGRLILSANDGRFPRGLDDPDHKVQFASEEVDSFFSKLTAARKKAVVKYLTALQASPGE